MEHAKKEKNIFGVRWDSLLLVAYTASFLGWCVENACHAITGGMIDSRHQLLPFISAYGLGIFLLFLIFGTPLQMRIFKKRILPEQSLKNNLLRFLLYFAAVYVLVIVGEISVGMFFEKVFGVRAWNYNNIPTHITQYTSLITTLGFATGITLLMGFAFSPAVGLFERIPARVSKPLAIVLGVLLGVDYCIMFGYTCIFGRMPEYWFIRF